MIKVSHGRIHHRLKIYVRQKLTALCGIVGRHRKFRCLDGERTAPLRQKLSGVGQVYGADKRLKLTITSYHHVEAQLIGQGFGGAFEATILISQITVVATFTLSLPFPKDLRLSSANASHPLDQHRCQSQAYAPCRVMSEDSLTHWRTSRDAFKGTLDLNAQPIRREGKAESGRLRANSRFKHRGSLT